MKVASGEFTPSQADAEAVVVGIFSDEGLNGPAAELDRATHGVVTRLMEAREITGKAYELVPLLGLTGIAARQALVVGLGEREKFDRGTAFRTSAAAARHLAAKERQRVAMF